MKDSADLQKEKTQRGRMMSPTTETSRQREICHTRDHMRREERWGRWQTIQANDKGAIQNKERDREVYTRARSGNDHNHNKDTTHPKTKRQDIQ